MKCKFSKNKNRDERAVRFDKMTIWLVMLYGTECWAVKKQLIHKMSIAKIKNVKMNKWEHIER